MEKIRLQVFLAKCGIASRRKSEELIKSGVIEVNGEKVINMGLKVSPNDAITINGKLLKIKNEKIYVMLNKPCGYVSTVKDQFSRPTVLHLLKGIDERIYPVGRLDYNTSGLLILTNDGEFCYKMTHPKHNIDKVYIADIDGEMLKDQIYEFENGLRIDDYITSDAKIKVLKKYKNSTKYQVTIHEGKNRQVRKMFSYFGYNVIQLKRISLGNLTLGQLSEGEWRYISTEEIEQLANLCYNQQGH